jgi:adenine-specific DNA-methyltransferase
MVVNSHEKLAQGLFKLHDLVSDTKDQLHSKRFVEGKDLDRWLPCRYKWLEWASERAPALFRRPTFPELYEADEKLLILRIAGKKIRVCYDHAQTLSNHTVIVCLSWHNLSDVKNNSLKKAARYIYEKPSSANLPKREELEKISRSFAVKFLMAIMNSSIAFEFLQSVRKSNTDLYPDDWKKLPIPKATPEQQKPIIELVDKILTIKYNNKTADVSKLEAEIDDKVAHLYGLTDKEMKIIREE